MERDCTKTISLFCAFLPLDKWKILWYNSAARGGSLRAEIPLYHLVELLSSGNFRNFAQTFILKFVQFFTWLLLGHMV